MSPALGTHWLDQSLFQVDGALAAKMGQKKGANVKFWGTGKRDATFINIIYLTVSFKLFILYLSFITAWRHP